MRVMKKNGFTLVELLVVMTIIAILVGISLVSFDGIRKSARDSKRKADLESIRSALEVYRTDCRSYPIDGSFTFGGSLVCSVNGVTYMDVIPTESLIGTYKYAYKQVSANKYYLCAHLEGSSAGHDTSCGVGVYCGTANAACNYVVSSP